MAVILNMPLGIFGWVLILLMIYDCSLLRSPEDRKFKVLAPLFSGKIISSDNHLPAKSRMLDRPLAYLSAQLYALIF
jgi:hypothetical protein